jgi:hypothetical protein
MKLPAGCRGALVRTRSYTTASGSSNNRWEKATLRGIQGGGITRKVAFSRRLTGTKKSALSHFFLKGYMLPHELRSYRV